MSTILRYAARVIAKARQQTKSETEAAQKRRPAVRRQTGTLAFVGAGKLANFLAPALAEAGFTITEIVARERRDSVAQAKKLARRIGASATTIGTAEFGAEVLWLAVPDGEIRGVAELLADRLESSATKFVFHSSGALGSRELGALRKAGLEVASVHPLMTFVANSKPALSGVPFAIEGDAAAVRKARNVVRALGGRNFVIAQSHKAAYHAWATMTSPLLLAYLVTLEQAAGRAGLTRRDARQMSMPIVRQTIDNYARLGPANSFSGPFIRGDVETVRKHLALLRGSPDVRAVYVALARVALEGLPVGNRERIRRLIGGRVRR